MALAVADSSVIIAFLDRRDHHHAAAREALAALARDGADIVVSTITLAECMVRPLRSQGGALRSVEHFFSAYPRLVVEPVDVEIACLGAQLRARHQKLRVPDALIIATGEHLGADQILGCDKYWSRVTKLAKILSLTHGV